MVLTNGKQRKHLLERILLEDHDAIFIFKRLKTPCLILLSKIHSWHHVYLMYQVKVIWVVVLITDYEPAKIQEQRECFN
jgi:hypothetical protein